MRDTRKIVGYVRTLKEDDNSRAIQLEQIMSYCNRQGITCESVFVDVASHYCRKNDHERAEILGLSNSRWRPVFLQWEEMLLQIKAGAIKCVLVDTSLRLYSGKEQQEVLYRICRAYNVQIIEVGSDVPTEEAVIVYHRSLEPDNRTCSVLQDIDNLYSFSRLFNDSREVRLLLDTKNVRSNYKKIQEKKNCTVICKRFEILNRKALSVVHLAQNNKIISLEEGNLVVTPLFDIPARAQNVAIYDKSCSRYEFDTEDIRAEKFALFSERMQWKIVSTYMDNEEDAMRYMELIRENSKYDSVLMDTISKFGESISATIRPLQIFKSIYTLKEGEIALWKPKKSF